MVAIGLSRSARTIACYAGDDVLTAYEMTAYRNLYNKRQWRRQSLAQKRKQPLCEMCLAQGKITPAEISDHVVPHRGDINLFLLGRLMSLCRHHHESTKKEIEHKGYSTEIGPDGMPTDSNHPCYAHERPKRQKR
jgi:5-methylcytosine-specific restriction enzyme A